ncbi:sulfite exporter TauE/SafE family protein [Stutzerimonas nitrititolerans]|uniref:sulfite exporter TauE/SafE family protein n=1 Tax=Stutzerimonas nitrititolerans TaxID=2482751 RepID=UPI002113D32F|nr:sulfite exporter TauE/SafE family protein [Stutzerimonas nitrititolerans]
MILALGLMATVPPSVAVPVALLLDLVCSAGLWIGACRGFHQPVGYRLIAGMLLAVPIGTLLLTILPALWMTPAVAAVCLVGSGLILARPVAAQKTVDQSRHLAFPAGLASGLAMSMASAGGPPLMLYLLRSGLDVTQLRATAICSSRQAALAHYSGCGYSMPWGRSIYSWRSACCYRHCSATLPGSTCIIAGNPARCGSSSVPCLQDYRDGCC